MLGTIVNTACIVAGTLIGTLFKKGLGEKYTKTLFNAMGLASIALGANSFVANMPKSEFPVRSACWRKRAATVLRKASFRLACSIASARSRS